MNLNLGKKEKNRLIIAFAALLVLGISVLAARQTQEIRKKAQTAPTFTICPTGIAGANGCDFIGGDGIQMAVDAAAAGTASQKTTVLIKNGGYTRSSFSETEVDDGRKRKCFIDTKEKNIVLQGETSSKLDGAGSVNMSGICAKSGDIVVKELIISGFKRDDNSCFITDTTSPCSRGRGIQLENSASLTIQNSEISQNQDIGIGLWNSAKTFVTNSTFYNNASGMNQNSNALIEIKNSILSKNRNGIITEVTQNVNLSYSLLYNNGNYEADSVVLQSGPGNIVGQDPKFVNPDSGDFHLQTGSPAINTGDPSLCDTDDTRSDMGLFGGNGDCGVVVSPFPTFYNCSRCSKVYDYMWTEWGALNCDIDPPQGAEIVRTFDDVNCGLATPVPGYETCSRCSKTLEGRYTWWKLEEGKDCLDDPSENTEIFYAPNVNCHALTASPTPTNPTVPATPTPIPGISCDCIQGLCESTCSAYHTANFACANDAHCPRAERYHGDSEGSGTVTLADYGYYRRVVLLDPTVPTSINVDFNGDGERGTMDGAIVLTTLGLLSP